MSTQSNAEVLITTTQAWPTGLDPKPYAEALERAKADPEYLAALGRELADALEYGMEPEEAAQAVLRHLAALAFTVRRVPALMRALKARGVPPDPGPEEAMATRMYFDFRCWECGGEVSVMGSEPEEAPVDPFGYAQLWHEPVSQRCTLATDDHGQKLDDRGFTARLAERLGLFNTAGVDLELAALRHAMAGRQVKWLIPDVMERGMMAALYGPAGTGKSLLGLEWAVQAALAGEHVVYFDEENPEGIFIPRLADMGVDPVDLAGRLTYYSFTGWTVDTEEGAAAIVDACQGADLVVFDSWNKFFASGSQSGDMGALDAYRLTVKPLRAKGIGILRLDHTGHADATRPAGSHVKLGDVDHNWQMKAKDLGDKRAEVTLVHQKARTGNGPDVIRLRREPDPFLAHVPAGQEKVTEVAGSTDAEKVAALVEVLDEMGVDTDWSVRKTADALRKAGKGARQNLVADAQRLRRSTPATA